MFLATPASIVPWIPAPMAELRKRAAKADGAASADVASEVDKTAKVAASADFVTRHERYVPFVIFLVAAFTRFYRLDQPPGAQCSRDTAAPSKRLGSPFHTTARLAALVAAGVVFDESHFGKFTGAWRAVAVARRSWRGSSTRSTESVARAALPTR
jgi:hypothetical protein